MKFNYSKNANVLHCFIWYFSIERFTNVKCKSLIDDVHQYWITRWFRILLSIAATVPCQEVDGWFSQYFCFVHLVLAYWCYSFLYRYMSIFVFFWSGVIKVLFSIRLLPQQKLCVICRPSCDDSHHWRQHMDFPTDFGVKSFLVLFLLHLPRPLPAGHFLFHRNLDPSYAESLRSTNYRGDYTTQSPIFVAGRFRTLSQWTLMEIFCDYYKTPSRI